MFSAAFTAMIFHETTGRTEMGPHAQALLDVLATSAALLGRIARRGSYHHVTSSRGLVREDAEKRAPTRIMNALGETVIARHSLQRSGLPRKYDYTAPRSAWQR
jgi:hypothetical protein